MARNLFSSMLQMAFADAVKDDEETRARLEAWGRSRRAFLKNSLLAAGGAILLPSGMQTPMSSTPVVAIIGAGMAGLNAAWQLKKAGVDATIYEASKRTGGRMYTLRGKMGEELTTDIGGEFVDSTHEEILGLIGEFGLEYYDLRKDPLAHKAFFFGGRRLVASDLRVAIQPFVSALAKDIASLPARLDHTTGSQFERLDRMSITEYMTALGISGWLYDFLNVVLTREYGMEASRQSAINFLIMFEPPAEGNNYELFGEDHEIFKIKGGSQTLTDKLTEKVGDRIRYERRLAGIERSKDGGYRLLFTNGEARVDYLILTIPFTVLRRMAIRIPMSEGKHRSIHELGYGNSCKFVMAMQERPWREQGFQGYTFNDGSFGCGWDSSQLQAGTAGSFTVFGGGDNGEHIADATTDELLKSYLPVLDATYPGAAAVYGGKNLKFCWKTYPFTGGGYSCFEKGQWSTIAGYEAEPVEDIYFAGEHVSLAFQGYMNGAAQTGKMAAAAVLEKIHTKWTMQQRS